MGIPLQHGADGIYVVTVAELLDHPGPLCAKRGTVWARCTRAAEHPPPCGALATDTEGRPLVVTWYEPDWFPLPGT